MRGNRRAETRTGVATTEFTVILVAVAVILIAVVVNYGGNVNALWAAAATDGGLETLSGAVEDSIADMGDDDDPPCPYEYNASTGRWHDPGNDGAFVSFDDAAAANCS